MTVALHFACEIIYLNLGEGNFIEIIKKFCLLH